MTATEIRANWLHKQLPTSDHTQEAIAEALFEIAAQLAELNAKFNRLSDQEAINVFVNGGEMGVRNG